LMHSLLFYQQVQHIYYQQDLVMKKIKEIFSNRNFICLFFGRTISKGGTILYSIVAVLYVYNVTHSGWSVGKLEIISFLPAILLGMIGGTIADYYSRKKILITSNLVLATLFIILSLSKTIIAVYVISFLVGFTANFSAPASSAILPQIIKKRLIVQANSIFEIAWQSMRLVIPALGSFLFTWIGFTNACLLNAVSYLLCAGLIWQLKTNFKLIAGGKRQSLISKFSEFFRTLKHKRIIVNIILLLCVFRLGTGAIVALIVVFLKETLNARDSAVGIVMSVIAGGTLVGGIIAPLFEDKLKQPKPIQLSLVIFVLSLSAIIITQDLIITYFMFGFIGIGNAYFNIGLNTFFQQNFEQKILGRIYGFMEAAMMLSQIISVGIGGLLCEYIGINNVYLLGILLIGTAAILSVVLLKPMNILIHQRTSAS
jgi:DHA3 family macrolide efflux protein-like MFS transporter